MIQLAEYFAWCTVQVTLFTAAAGGVYWRLGRQRANRNVRLLGVSFGIIAMLTFACVSPWPQWGPSASWHSPAVQTISPLDLVAPPNSGPTLLSAAPDAPLPDGIFKAEKLTFHNVRIPLDDTLQAANSEGDARPWWFWIVAAAWIAAVIGAARFAVGFSFVKRLERRSTPIDDSAALGDFERLRAELGVPQCVELREAPTLGVAATVGWRRPLVLLPAGWREWSADERRAVLAHELAHVAQRHFPVWIASQLATVLHFYHPLVHWLGRRLRLEQANPRDSDRNVSYNRRCCENKALIGPARRLHL